VKGARTAAMGFAKRVISKVRSFEAGHSCIVDSTLRDLLFCISRKISEASIDKAQEVVSIDTPVLLSGDSPALIPATGLHCTPFLFMSSYASVSCLQHGLDEFELIILGYLI